MHTWSGEAADRSPDITDELRALIEAEQQRDGQGSPIFEPLRLVTVLDELQGWLDDPRSYAKDAREREWRSLASDLKMAINTRGANLRDATPALSELAALVTPQSGANLVSRAKAREHLDTAMNQLGADDAVSAAADDLLRAASNGRTSHHVLRKRYFALDSAARSAGKNLGSMRMQLEGVLADREGDIELARYLLADTTAPRTWSSEAARVPVAERLDLFRRMVVLPPQPRSTCVWFVFGNARFSGWRFEIGHITFFDGHALKAALEELQAGRLSPQVVKNLPPEWRDAPDPHWPRHETIWPRDDRWVAARVDLGSDIFPDPVGTARDLLEAVIDLSLRGRPTSWEPWSGHLIVVDGQVGTHAWFAGPDRNKKLLPPDHTHALIRESAPRLIQRLRVQGRLRPSGIDREMSAAAADARALRTIEASDPAAGIVTTVRILERTASLCDQDWRQHTKRSLRGSVVANEMSAAAFGALWDYLSSPWARTAHEDAERHLVRLRKDEGGGMLRLDYGYALDLLPSVADALPRYHPHGRRIRTLARYLGDPPAVEKFALALEAQFDANLIRLSRQRNAIAHGGPVHLSTIESVLNFGTVLAVRATEISLSASTSGRSAAEEFDREAKLDDGWRSAISTAETVREAVFGSTGVGSDDSEVV